MTYEIRIRDHRQKMSKSFSRLADYILDSYIQTALMTATEIAHQVDVDAATVVRFAQKLGYSGFPELQNEIKDRVKQELLIQPSMAEDPNSINAVVNTTLGMLKEAVEQTKVLLNIDALSTLVAEIEIAQRIFIIPDALGKSVAENFSNLLEEGGFANTLVQANPVDLARILTTSGKGDLFLAIDVAGKSDLIGKVLRQARKKNIKTSAIVGAASYPTAVVPEIVLAAQSQPIMSVSVVVVGVIVQTLSEALKWEYENRFKGVEQRMDKVMLKLKSG